MQDLLREGFDEGARGFSTGLSYAPGHVRDDRGAGGAHDGRRRGRQAVPHAHALRRVDGVRASLDEAIATAERSGVELNVSHLYPRPIDPPDEADR